MPLARRPTVWHIVSIQYVWHFEVCTLQILLYLLSINLWFCDPDRSGIALWETIGKTSQEKEGDRHGRRATITCKPE